MFVRRWKGNVSVHEIEEDRVPRRTISKIPITGFFIRPKLPLETGISALTNADLNGHALERRVVHVAVTILRAIN